MSVKQRREGLAQMHDLRRRLADRDFSDVPDEPDGPDAEVIEIIQRRRRRYDGDHPVMVSRRDIDG